METSSAWLGNAEECKTRATSSSSSSPSSSCLCSCPAAILFAYVMSLSLCALAQSCAFLILRCCERAATRLSHSLSTTGSTVAPNNCLAVYGEVTRSCFNSIAALQPLVGGSLCASCEAAGANAGRPAAVCPSCRREETCQYHICVK